MSKKSSFVLGVFVTLLVFCAVFVSWCGIAKHKGYNDVFEYIQSWSIFNNEDSKKTPEDEVADDALDEIEDETSEEDNSNEIPSPSEVELPELK